jgi:F0F1-type ATP synthase assembly protein I
MFGGGDRKELARYMTIGQVGLEMAVPPAIGIYLDLTFGWSPWGVIIGAGLGLIGGLAHLVHLANKQEDGKGPSHEQKPS